MVERLHEDTLFLACTRPAMVGGVTMEAMAINAMFSCILFLGAGDVFYLGVGGIIHVVFRAVCKHDHNMFRVLRAYVETNARCLNKQHWGGSSVSPLKVVRRYSEKDFNLA